jgi:hypothetical protein
MRVDNVTGIRNLCAVAAHLLQHLPVNAATKFAVRTVLRVAVDKSTPGYKGNNNKKNCQQISVAAERILNDKSAGLIADHAIPIGVLLKKVYDDQIKDVDGLVALVYRYAMMVLITKAEDKLLRKAGLVKAMPPDWDGEDPFARYRGVGIQLKPNPSFTPSVSGALPRK